MQHWTNDHQARALGPGAKGVYVVLFLSSQDPTHDISTDADITRFAALSLPRHLPRVVVDTEGAPETARWFGVTQTPVLAVISDGALLAIEHQCEESVCERLIAFADQQRSCLEAERYTPKTIIPTGHPQ